MVSSAKESSAQSLLASEQKADEKVVNILQSELEEIKESFTTKKPEEEAAPTTKECPFCKTEIHIEATRCPHCTSELDKVE